MIVCLYPFFFIASIIIPRNYNLWVFGNKKGYIDNTKYFFEYSSKKEEDKKIYWLANSIEEYKKVKRKGYLPILRRSFRGYWISSRAGLTFICNGYGDVNRLLALTSIIINFWHGTPIKKIYFDSKEIMDKFKKYKIIGPVLKLIYLYLNRKITFYYASNEFERIKVCNAARINLERSISLGAPRFDYIRNAPKPKNLFDLSAGRKIVLYAPTWRLNDNWHSGFYLSKNDYLYLNETLNNKNMLLVVKIHPLTKPEVFEMLGLKESDNIIYADNYGLGDINDLYKYSDYLITDLSSSIFDFLIFDRPVKLFMPDYGSYIKEVGVYKEFIDIIRKYSCISWQQVCVEILRDDWKIDKLFRDIAKESSNYKDVSKTILDDIKSKNKIL